MKNTHVKAHSSGVKTLPVAVLARALALPTTASAGEFVFMPAGENVIEASVDGKGEKITVLVDAATAAALQADLTARLDTGIRPALDYNHDGGRASGWPTGFRWSDGFGVICEVEWTPTAVAAIRAGEWKYFSPEFRYDRKTKRVLGLPSTGPVGGLVNDPAFRAMPAVAARNISAGTGGDEESPPDDTGLPQPNQPTKHHQRMNAQIVAALSAAGLLSATEASADNAADLLTARIADLKAGESIKASLTQAHTAALTALRAELDAHKTTMASAAVDAAVKAFRLAPKDEATQTFWKKAIIADPEAVKALNAIAPNPALKPTNVRSTEDAPEQEPNAAFYEAVTARARTIERTSKITFAAAFTQAEAEIKAQA